MGFSKKVRSKYETLDGVRFGGSAELEHIYYIDTESMRVKDIGRTFVIEGGYTAHGPSGVRMPLNDCYASRVKAGRALINKFKGQIRTIIGRIAEEERLLQKQATRKSA